MADYEKSKAQDNKGTSAGLEMTSELPVDAKTNVAGVPTYAGLSGSRLSVAITLIATTGFLLFGEHLLKSTPLMGHLQIFFHHSRLRSRVDVG